MVVVVVVAVVVVVEQVVMRTSIGEEEAAAVEEAGFTARRVAFKRPLHLIFIEAPENESRLHPQAPNTKRTSKAKVQVLPRLYPRASSVK
ncbi:hypothetical protein E2C01_072106 [Portunus trituberculatus]|uniref:Secreted protein n=1 Tax=Portunus trituberculatus TaxID=210409 RepID=A0A5B7I825_PORTR|nr:hypothetical protein [Portunus trituberculatus]